MKTTYKKGDFVEFMTRQPDVHFREIFGHEQVSVKDIQETCYIGKIKSVINNGKEYLIISLSPLTGFFCMEDASKIIRQIKEDEIPEEMKRCIHPSLFIEPNVYINHNKVKGTTAQKCEQIARNALEFLFPNEEIVSAEFSSSDFLLEDILANMDSLMHDYYREDCVKSREELEILKSQTAQKIKQMRFKEYYCVNLGIKKSVDNDSIYFELLKNTGFQPLQHSPITILYLVAVDLNFQEVSIMRDINERSSFYRSLGPEFDYAYTLYCQFRNAIFQKKR